MEKVISAFHRIDTQSLFGHEPFTVTIRGFKARLDPRRQTLEQAIGMETFFDDLLRRLPLITRKIRQDFKNEGFYPHNIRTPKDVLLRDKLISREGGLGPLGIRGWGDFKSSIVMPMDGSPCEK